MRKKLVLIGLMMILFGGKAFAENTHVDSTSQKKKISIHGIKLHSGVTMANDSLFKLWFYNNSDEEQRIDDSLCKYFNGCIPKGDPRVPIKLKRMIAIAEDGYIPEISNQVKSNPFFFEGGYISSYHSTFSMKNEDQEQSLSNVVEKMPNSMKYGKDFFDTLKVSYHSKMAPRFYYEYFYKKNDTLFWRLRVNQTLDMYKKTVYYLGLLNEKFSSKGYEFTSMYSKNENDFITFGVAYKNLKTYMNVYNGRLYIRDDGELCLFDFKGRLDFDKNKVKPLNINSEEIVKIFQDKEIKNSIFERSKAEYIIDGEPEQKIDTQSEKEFVYYQLRVVPFNRERLEYWLINIFYNNENSIVVKRYRHGIPKYPDLFYYFLRLKEYQK